jgi:hypothetical protein
MSPVRLYFHTYDKGMSGCLLHRPDSLHVLFPACLFSRLVCTFIFQIDRMSAFFKGDFFGFFGGQLGPVGKILFCTGPTRPARAGKCSLIPDRLVQPRKEIPERLERGGPYWLQKLRWMGTQRVQMKEVLPCWFVGLVVPEQEILFSLGCSSQPSTKYFFPQVHYFK